MAERLVGCRAQAQNSLTMDLNLPWIHESFHATFSSANRFVDPEERWTAELPLVVSNRIIGRIDIESSIRDHAFGEVIAEVSEILDSLQPFFVETIENTLEKKDLKPETAETTGVEFESSQSKSGSHALDAG